MCLEMAITNEWIRRFVQREQATHQARHVLKNRLRANRCFRITMIMVTISTGETTFMSVTNMPTTHNTANGTEDGKTWYGHIFLQLDT